MPNGNELAYPALFEAFLAADDTLAARDQTAYYVSLPIVFGGDFDLTFEKAVCILIGENRSGKPTLLEMIVTMARSGEGGGAQGTTVVGPSRGAGKDADRLGDLPRAAGCRGGPISCPWRRSSWLTMLGSAFPTPCHALKFSPH